jgi:glycosyltransferase involved in cell wall biosynthesis
VQPHRPILSVIIPVLNGAATLSGLLESLNRARSTSQDSQKTLQIVVKDGLSTDSTIEIATALLQKHDVLISSKDNGIYEAMNQGVARATGEWLLFLGSDDELICLSICDNIKASRGCDGLLLGASVTPAGRLLKNRWGWRLLFAHSVNHQACIYHRSIFEKYKYPTTYKLAGDYWLNLKLYLDGTGVTKMPTTLLVRFNDSGLSSRNKSLGNQEVSLVKKEILGPIGSVSNLIVKIKRTINAS